MPGRQHNRLQLRRCTSVRRGGVSLLELVAGIIIMGTAIYPALRLMRDGMTISRDNETRNLVSSYCVSILEQQLAQAAAGWTNGTSTGNNSGDGYASVKYTATRSDAVVDGGVVGKLMAITVTAWYDTNGNGSVDTGEIKITMATKVAKMSLYQAAAGS